MLNKLLLNIYPVPWQIQASLFRALSIFLSLFLLSHKLPDAKLAVAREQRHIPLPSHLLRPLCSSLWVSNWPFASSQLRILRFQLLLPRRRELLFCKDFNGYFIKNDSAENSLVELIFEPHNILQARVPRSSCVLQHLFKLFSFLNKISCWARTEYLKYTFVPDERSPLEW